MLDIKILRTDPDRIRTALKNRNNDLDISPVIELDTKRREILSKVEQMKATQNEISKKIPAMKKAFAKAKIAKAKAPCNMRLPLSDAVIRNAVVI